MNFEGKIVAKVLGQKSFYEVKNTVNNWTVLIKKKVIFSESYGLGMGSLQN